MSTIWRDTGLCDEAHLQFNESGRLFFNQVVVTGVEASAFTPHSKVTSLPRTTLRF